MATETTKREWLGLGRVGWGIYAVVALVNMVALLSISDSIQEGVFMALLIAAATYVLIRLYKFVLGLFARLIS